jgi:hypothetical protein
VAFSDSECEAIDKALAGFCERHSLPDIADQLRTTYDIDRLAVIVYEERPGWRGAGEWMRTPIARFRYVRRQDEWELYWMRADFKWHFYEPAGRVRRLSMLVRDVERDEYGCFFG